MSEVFRTRDPDAETVLDRLEGLCDNDLWDIAENFPDMSTVALLILEDRRLLNDVDGLGVQDDNDSS